MSRGLRDTKSQGTVSLKYLHIDVMPTTVTFTKPLNPIYARAVEILVKPEIQVVSMALAARRISHVEHGGVVSWPVHVHAALRTGFWITIFPCIQ